MRVRGDVLITLGLSFKLGRGQVYKKLENARICASNRDHIQLRRQGKETIPQVNSFENRGIEDAYGCCTLLIVKKIYISGAGLRLVSREGEGRVMRILHELDVFSFPSRDYFFRCLSHPVDVLLLHGAELPLEVDLQLEVEIPLVPVIGLHLEDPVEFLSLLARDGILQVEDGLLPMGVGGLGRGAETHALVALGKLDVEEGYQSLARNKRKAFQKSHEKKCLQQVKPDFLASAFLDESFSPGRSHSA